MRKKVALAAALIHRPQVLFLDEPFEGIDPVSSRVIRDILRDLTRTGTTIFFSSHIMEVVERLCTRIGIISQGTLIAEGTLDELRARAGEAQLHAWRMSSSTSSARTSMRERSSGSNSLGPCHPNP